MNVRPANLSDSKRISELMAELGYDASESLIKNKVTEISESDIDAVFVAEMDGNVLGCISCHLTQLFHKKGRAGRITSLVVSNTVRGQGIGKKLIEKADEYFRKNGCLKAEVTSGDHRTGAHEVYTVHGYKPDERRFIKYYK